MVTKEIDMWTQVYFEIIENKDGTFSLETNDTKWKDYNVEGCRDVYEAMKELSATLADEFIDVNYYFG